MEYVERIRKLVLDEMDLSKELSDQEVLSLIDEAICKKGDRIYNLLTREQTRMRVFHALRRFDVLQELIEDDRITEIMVNGANCIFYEKEGQLFRWDKGFTSNEKLEDVIQTIAGGNNKLVNESAPIVDTRLPDGSRVNIVLSPISLDGSAITIRKFPKEPMTMERLIAIESISEEIALFLKQLVAAGYNIFISGGTGSGKTTFLNALSGYIPKEERIITIEDAAELQLLHIPNLVRLEARRVQTEKGNNISIRDLIRTALRMRPDRIILGECRGSEALDMLQAMNTGHDGSLSTGHGNSCMDMLSRLETMVLMGMDLPIEAIRGQLASGIDILIHLSRMRDHSRKLTDVMEIGGIEKGQIQLNPLYHFEETHEEGGKVFGKWNRCGKLQHKDKLALAGIAYA